MIKNEQFHIIKTLRQEIAREISKPLRFGLILLAVLIVGFGGWGIFAKIDKAAIAIGEIAVVGNNKVVQHLEGGVIEKILVKEGDIVKEGDALIKLSKTSASANVEIFESTLYSSIAEYSRLVAERDGLDAVKYPDSWLTNKEKYKTFIETQDQIFKERKTSYDGKIGIINERINQLDSEIKGLRSQLVAAHQQLGYTSDQVAQAEKLFENKNTTITRVLDAKTRKSQIEGSIGELTSSIAKAEQAISENKLNKINIKNETLNEILQQIKEVQSKMNEFKERGGAATDTLSRTEIRAPISGIVKDMKFKTAGSAGVIPPNSEVLTIVPTSDEMIAEIKISPNDIDVVRTPNLKTRVRLSAYSARHIPMLDGVLTYVSADAFHDPQTGMNFYKGKVSIDISLLKKYTQGNNDVNHEQYLYPGMPVEVYIVTGERSPLSYLIEPIRNDFRRAFREE
jgi:HlyD family secretion protein